MNPEILPPDRLDAQPRSSEPLRVLRISSSLQGKLREPGFEAEVIRIYENGFDLCARGGFFGHFREGPFLISPFGAVLDGPARPWIDSVCLQEGEIFHRRGEILYRANRPGAEIHAGPSEVVSLKRTHGVLPPQPEALLSYIRLLMGRILERGRSGGMLGALCLLDWVLHPISLSNAAHSRWSYHSLPWIRMLVQSVLTRNLGCFEQAWEGLSGVGPGLTPAGDDFLVGFLAAHMFFSSPFTREPVFERFSAGLKRKASETTTPVASHFLREALEGSFSELIYLALDDLTASGAKDGPTRMCNTGRLLEWGHTSGTDTLTGLAFGLASLLLSTSLCREGGPDFGGWPRH